ncbi:PIN/TRAM domain-containing protein [Lentilactobacillus hilgardii]|uniref:PIN domain protein n=1 Tax=Lentilactobacillus hilgardii (strain ATCC 8290 / DSM 20176 / CCUG 30140 / JCM 1155 / KCTC 3500 / NBRC 15886 / NCIMB 8040 / NRRL B-1843 / 9) TaxID=1423757 RepID=C0XFZ9_LENH9|nr:PIN/TRAM domain-containing protein [Lentilactobacillus hilgardii]EEI25715.1 PIN domain protein [Lentilactobacillus hilgardii DSM 20176 = ATCC 8290]KRK56425.1 PIN domain superfamily integral membrane protein [Lentilactobacillus hilgardii DSM 20176 = ATCC 8290]MCP9332266.1 PIN/TRAM domain-containing protein [Lentilactobacillus hilgardii]MCP9348741.1 PIN/TRAM domain-containing protein [Lentilactobacillus hilgardii]MCP9351680.1 PIN/TRAM domain-containing protein [Lentilactobacillus hilgardii]
MLKRKRIVRIVLTLAGAAIGASYFPLLWLIFQIAYGTLFNNVITNAILGAIIFYIISLLTGNYVLKAIDRVESRLTSQSPISLLFGTLGLIVGLVLAVLISIVFFKADTFFLNTMIPIILMLVLGYFGFRLGNTQSDRWRKVFQFRRKTETPRTPGEKIIDKPVDDNYSHYKILDTNILIDGRIYDVIKTGFVEGTLLVPKFVLYELQYIADSSDSVKRVRGRRGLDILNKLQKEKMIPIEIYEKDYEDIDEVDTKLIQLAKDVNGVIITNDYNLNKVIQFQHVKVLNINALATALRQKILPGQQLNVMVVKNGTERQQGVAYLDDGTMVVVEDGRYFFNQHIDVVVTSAIQTDAGKMIFARPEHSTKNITDKIDDNDKNARKNSKQQNGKKNAAKK